MAQVPIQGAFAKAAPVLDKLNRAGYEAYFVGGSVRDALLDQPIHDVDIATSAYPQEVKELFHKTVDVGIDHGTVMVLHGGESYEITTFRTESTYQDYRRPDQVTFVRSLEEDLKRRDFTINALALDEKGEVIDLFGGLEDLEAGLIRAVGDAKERFHEDALRMMRAVRFQAQLDFEIEDLTLEGIIENGPLLEKIAVERIQEEWMKMMLSPSYQAGLATFLSTGLYAYTPVFRELKGPLTQVLKLQGSFHNEAQVWAMLAFAANLKPGQVRKLLKAWKSPNKILDQTLSTLEALKLLQEGEEVFDIYRLGLEAFLNADQLQQMMGKESRQEDLIARNQALAIHGKEDLVLDGNDLLSLSKRKPGPWLGRFFERVERLVVDRDLDNHPEALEAYLYEWLDTEGE